jgi:hypothetical protein
MLAVGPVRTVPPMSSRGILDHPLDVLDSSSKFTSLTVGGHGFSITVGRQAENAGAKEGVADGTAR